MALHTDLPIYKAGVELLTLAIRVQDQMPRGMKKHLGEKIVQHCTDMLDLMALANATQRAERAAHLQRQEAGVARGGGVKDCAVGVCSAPAHCREIGRCGERSNTGLYASQLSELCAALGWKGGTYHQVLAEVKRLRLQVKQQAVEPADAAPIQMREGPALDPRCAWPFPDPLRLVDSEGGEPA